MDNLMDETTQRALQTAYQLIKSGKKEAAFSLLASLIKANPNIVDAWYLMGFAVDDPQKQLYAFRQVLRLSPAHEGAKKQVTRLLNPPPPAPVPAPETKLPVEPARPPAPAVVSWVEQKQAEKKKPTSRAWLWVGFVVLLVCVVVVGATGVATGALPSFSRPTPTRIPRTLTPRPATAIPSPTPIYEPIFRTIACPFDVPHGTRVRCGMVKVPQNREKNLTELIEIPVVVYRSSKPSAGALVYLQGGPGVESIDWSVARFDDYVLPLLEDYDMVFFDPRGTGRSEPRLDCPDLNDIYLDAIFQARSEEEAFAVFTEAWGKCSKRFLEQGIDPAAFNTTQSAADVRDIVAALGYEQVNLIGISYGTRLALTIMRDYPEIVRAVVIDSVVPVQRKMINSRSEDIQYALDKMFADCANSQPCNDAYPGLQDKFNALIQRFDEKPVMVKVRDPGVGFVYDVPVNGVEMAGAVVEGMRYSPLLPVIPKAIYDIEKGDYTFLSFALGVSGGSVTDLNMGTYFSTVCHEQVYATTSDEMEADLAAPPIIKKFALLSIFGNTERVFQLCDSWGALPFNPLNALPVTADIPTLVLAGEYDPTTPVTTAEMVSNDLPDNYFYVIPGMGHAATVGNSCALDIVKGFLRDPSVKPDIRCLDALQAFEFFLPYDGRPVTFVPIIEQPQRLKGLVPQGWRKETIESIYYRRAYLFDPTQALFGALPYSGEQAFQAISKSFANSGFDETPKKIGAREANGLAWTIYSSKFNGEPVFLALAETSRFRTLLLVMVVSAPEKDASYNGLFLPMVDGLLTQ
jgi:pimeloyl-ACP methyl ester carboxylesterase